MRQVIKLVFKLGNIVVRINIFITDGTILGIRDKLLLLDTYL